jgi:hypothetical protein
MCPRRMLNLWLTGGAARDMGPRGVPSKVCM